MDREISIAIVKQIFEKCNHVEGKSIKLMPPDADSVLSKGNQIHIEVGDDESLRSCLAVIAEQNNLKIHEEEKMLIVYKPLVPQQTVIKIKAQRQD